jgi:uncharacterized membrane protein YeaQ/YmgE (transglycosylase-associated protein family)
MHPDRDGLHVVQTREGAFLMEVIVWLIFGLVVGFVAKLLMPGRDPGGFIVTMLLGIVGAMLGGWIGRTLGFYGEQETAGFILSVIGAIALLGAYRFIAPGRRRRI